MRLKRPLTMLRKLQHSDSAIAMTEFAFVLPVLLTLGLYGAEIARMAVTRTQISQIALSIADNASRLGQTDNSGVTPTITEDDVDAILDGAMRQGSTIGFYKRVRRCFILDYLLLRKQLLRCLA